MFEDKGLEEKEKKIQVFQVTFSKSLTLIDENYSSRASILSTPL